MDLVKVLSEMKAERDKLNRAIEALEGIDSVSSTRSAPAARTAKKRGHNLTAEGRKRLSDMMKKRWAERRKKVAAIRKPARKAA